MKQSDQTETILPLIHAMQRGNAAAASRVFEMLYADLRARARAYVRSSARQSLNATAVVHEAYIKFIGARSKVNDRGHLLAILSGAMRQILTDHAIKRGRQKRIPPGEREPIDEVVIEIEDSIGNLEEIDAALSDLRALDETKARAVELHVFGGLTLEQTAASLGVPSRTFDRMWRDVKLFFACRLPLHANLASKLED